jgi:hypothetical protein
MFLTLSKVLEAFPPLNIKKFMLSCINSTGYGVVGCNDQKRFGRNLPILPFYQQVESRTIVVLVMP